VSGEALNAGLDGGLNARLNEKKNLGKKKLVKGGVQT
jgi:hypothetical protein